MSGLAANPAPILEGTTPLHVFSCLSVSPGSRIFLAWKRKTPGRSRGFWLRAAEPPGLWDCESGSEIAAGIGQILCAAEEDHHVGVRIEVAVRVDIDEYPSAGV